MGGASGVRERGGRGEAGSDAAGVGRDATPWAAWWGEPCGAANAAVGMGERGELGQGRRRRRSGGADIDEERKAVCVCNERGLLPFDLSISFSPSLSPRLSARCGKYAARVAARRRRIGRAEAPSRGI